ncbi:hypothetical protein [Streptomyces griseocarneus]|nr:hypothetical protein [Streptomyces griseocarneus]
MGAGLALVDADGYDHARRRRLEHRNRHHELFHRPEKEPQT